MEELDTLDYQVINLLQENGRATNTEIANEIGVSEGTVRRRYRNLIEEGVIKVVAIPDPSKLGRGTTAVVGLQVDPAEVEPAANSMAKFPEVQYVSITTGAYDIFIWVALPSPEQLSTFLRSEIGSISGVKRTETFVNLAIKKNPAGPSS
ncbi:MAG: transcriptional regulator [Dehalococcoidia bacterium]|nr:transcriptional regulator [Dehalococcoidia bacterium]|tara:strand:+ start:7149 stop:7598 length:450 start_codon:yes stop_codon:yes gene_type:complete